jgi:inosine-uridine nucleoside N-ribohydrolase
MIRAFASILLVLYFGTENTAQKLSKNQRIPIILDTDMDSDVDDVGALAMLHSYEKQGKVRILGVVVTSDDAYSAPCTEALNRYFGRKDIPVGVSQKDSLRSFSKYTRQIAEEFPGTLKTNADAPDAVTIYRKLLAEAADHSVVIITIGHLTSLSRLLHSKADAVSSLSGEELVSKKVKRWSCMGGQFPTGKEANFYRPDPQSTVDVISKWKLPVVFAGWEVGNQIVTGGKQFKEKVKQGSPVYRGYELYNNFAGRASWDQISILEAVEGAEPYFTVEKNGHVKVAGDGSNSWAQPPSGNHGFLKIKAGIDAIQQKIESLMRVE